VTFYITIFSMGSYAFSVKTINSLYNCR